MPFSWSDQQLAIFSHVEQNKGSLVVQALAGCAKTTTGVEIAKRAKGRIFFGAFNKSIADVIAEKVASNTRCTAGTFHSMGFKLWREIRQRSQVDSRKVSTLARQRYPYDKKVREVITDAVGFAKLDGLGLNGMQDYTDLDAWRELFELHDLVDDIPAGITDERVMEDCVRTFKASLDMCESKTECVIDFNDMLYAPLYFGAWKPQRFDMVIVDEAQDTNETRLRLAMEILVDKGTMISIGDKFQAIYQFAGASHGAMDKIKERTRATELPLTVTYRCPKKIVEMVNHHVPDYRAAEGNKEGKITVISGEEHIEELAIFWALLAKLNPTHDVILCRNTRPLVGIAKRLRSNGIACVVEGNSGAAIIAMLTKWGVDMTWGQYYTRINDYVGKSAAKFRAKNQEEKAEYVEEKLAIIVDIADSPTPDTQLREIVSRVERMFGRDNDDREILRLCTIHRSKGREWKRVVLVGRNVYMPSYWAKSEEDKLAEANVEYVAITRTIEELIEVDVPIKKDSKDPDWWEL